MSMKIPKERAEYIEQKLSVFNLARLQEFLSISKHLKKCKIGEEELKDYFAYILVKSEKQIQKNRDEIKKEVETWGRVAPKCPDCGDVLPRPERLCGKNIPTNQRGHSCHWYCDRGWDEDEPSDICGWERYTKENAVEITRDLLRGDLNGYNIP